MTDQYGTFHSIKTIELIDFGEVHLVPLLYLQQLIHKSTSLDINQLIKYPTTALIIDQVVLNIFEHVLLKNQLL